MPKRYRQIALSEAVDGMILSDAVLDTQGNVLLPQGTELTAAMLASLARHQIETVAIAEAPASTQDDGAEQSQQAARIDYLFRHPGAAGTATDTLHRYIRIFRAGAAP